MPRWIPHKRSNVSALTTISEIKQENEIAEQLQQELNALDQKISHITQELIQAQAIAFRTAFTKQSNWITNLQQKWYQSAASKSAVWHRDRLKILYNERREINIKLEKITGKFWINRIRRWLSIVAILIILGIVLWIMLMGIIAAIYLIPIWGSMVLIYIVIKNRIYKF